MRYLGLALFAEGPTDHAFLRPVLRRLCERLCAKYGRAPVEVSDVLELHTPKGYSGEDRAIRVLQAAKEAVGGWHVLFIHTDGAGDPEGARRQRIEPAARRVSVELGGEGHKPVAVVPVRETEAWALADSETLQAVFGTSLGPETLQLPQVPREVEKILDPKRALEAAYQFAQGGRQGRRRRRAAGMLEALGERVRLEVLADVPAFNELRRETREALSSLGYLSR